VGSFARQGRRLEAIEEIDPTGGSIVTDKSYDMTSLHGESEWPAPQTHVDAGKRARQAFRERAKPGAVVQLIMRESGKPEDCLVAIEDIAIGMIQSIGLQLSVRNGLTLAISWPRDGMPFVQEVWEVEEPKATQITVPHNAKSVKTRHGIQVTLKRDTHEDAPVDEDTL